MPEEEIISFCGDVCSECPRYKATQRNDIEKLEALSNLWFRLGFRDKLVDVEDIKCNGCNKNKDCSHNINNCEHLIGKNNCGECNYFPCTKIERVFQKTELIDEICREKCTNFEYNELAKAFLIKRQVLTSINIKQFNKNKTV